MARFDFHSPLSPEECVNRLLAVVLNAYSEVDGRVEHDSIRLKRRTFGLNSSLTFMIAKLIPDGTGTRIRGSMGPHPLLNGYVGVWVFVCCLAGLIALVTGNYPPTLLIFPGMVLGAVGFISFGRLLSRGQDRQLLEFVTATLEANSVIDTTVK